MFNNGGDRGFSLMVEIDPPIGENEPWGPRGPAWSYQAEERESFHAPFISGPHRLPNGNTFVCSGPQGRFFEVTSEGEIVWEYRNPYHVLPQTHASD